MSAAEVRGLASLQARLAAAGAVEPIWALLREEAQAIAEEARGQAPGALAATIEVIDDSRQAAPAFLVGTAHRAGRFLEFGTQKMRARPWLWPAFFRRSPRIKHKLRRLIASSFKAGRGGL